MNTQKVVAEIEALPAQAQQEVADFVSFLRTRYSRRPKSPAKAGNAFIGMWKNREDLKDSVATVRQLREREWSQ